MAGETFPDAPDFPPQSQPFKRDLVERILELERQAAIQGKNLTAYQRSNAAGMKATNLKISALQGVRIPPGTPINVTVYPYAYFNASGYPAAGARVYWGDQNDADHYQIWVGKKPIPGEEVLGDSPSMVVSQYGTADIRNLEVLTDYELAVRAVSSFGSYGLFTATVDFSTPNVLTQIGPFGDPTVWYKDGFGIVQWGYTGVESPATTEYTATVTKGTVAGTLNGVGNHANGVLAPNGKIYYPPGAGLSDGAIDTGDTAASRGVVLNPETLIAYETDYGLPEMLDYGGFISTYTGPGLISGGILGNDGWIYWTARVSIDGGGGPDTQVTYVVRLNPETGVAGVDDSGTDAFYSYMAKGGDGRIYCVPRDGLDVSPFLVITPGAGSSLDTLGYTPVAGEKFGQGVTDANGDVWFMPLETSNDFLVIRTAGVTVERVARSVTGALFGPVLAGEDLYCFGYNSSPGPLGTATWLKITPSGTQTSGTLLNTAKIVQTTVGSDGRIYALGAGSTDLADGNFGNNVYGNSIVYFNPETLDSGTTIVSVGEDWPSDKGVAGPDGTIYFRTTAISAIGDDIVAPEKFVVLETSRVDRGATYGGELPGYLKHMLVQRSTSGGEWITLGAMGAPGYFVDPTTEEGMDYAYRLLANSTADILGIPSAEIGLST